MVPAANRKPKKRNISFMNDWSRVDPAGTRLCQKPARRTPPPADIAPPGHCRRHDTDRPRAGNENVFTEHGELERRVNRVAERVEDGGHVEVDSWIVPPDVGHRQRNQFGECSWTVHADALSVSAEMAASRHAVAAAPARDVAFPGD
jgi:hypothetical protein